MTVGELIEKLGNYDPAMTVVVSGYEQGYDDPQVGTVKAHLRKRKDIWYLGMHKEAFDDENETECVMIARP